MKTFEEKFTAWVDGKLSGRELADFENEIAAMADAQSAQSEKLAAQKVGDLMRTYVHAPELKNADFFNHQLMQQIEAEQPRAQAREPQREKRAWSFWTLPRMAWAGACCIVLATALYFAADIPKTAQQAIENREYVAKVLSTQTDDPDITATAFHSKENNATVIWLDGLDYIPEDYKLK